MILGVNKMNKVNYEYKSVFKEDIMELLKIKEVTLSSTTLFKYSSILKSFDIWCLNNRITNNILTFEIINNWILDGCETKNHKVSVIRELAKNMNNYTTGNYIIPKKFYKDNIKHIPYIFSDNEIIEFINYLSTIENCRGFNYRKETYSLIFELLIFTGARKSEILDLKISDIDFENNLIFINHGKNDIQRMLPIDNILSKKLKDYKDLIPYENEDDYFFCNFHRNSQHRKRVSETCLLNIFRIGLNSINIPYKNIHEGPRIHDFRFTFIVKSIQKLVSENKNLNVYLPILSKYVGHTTFQDTLYYFKPKEVIFSKDNYEHNSLIPTLLEDEFYEE